MIDRTIGILQYFLLKTTAFFEVKFISAVILPIAAYLYDPTQYAALLGLFLLIILDFIFGVAASKKTGKPVTSAKFFRTPLKLAVYFSLIAAAHVSQYALPAQLGFLDFSLTGFLVMTEFISLLENAGRMGFTMPKKLLNQLHNFTKD